MFLVETRSHLGVRRVRRGRAVVLAMGYYDAPNHLNVAGEDLPHVSHYYTEPHPYYRQRVVIVGGKNSAAEAALDLYRNGAHVTLVHRRAVDVVRREERRRADVLDDAPAASGDATDETVEVREQRRAVQAALAQLPPDQREALELAYYGGLSQSELAERLGVPIGTIKSRMFAALARLRDLLGEQEAGLQS